MSKSMIQRVRAALHRSLRPSDSPAVREDWGQFVDRLAADLRDVPEEQQEAFARARILQGIEDLRRMTESKPS